MENPGLQENEAPRLIDINALLESLAADAQVIGRDIAVSGLAVAPYRGRLTALRRALQNLIDNAIKYGRNAAVRIEDDGTTLQLIVKDSGPGIDPAELGRITEPYYRPDAARRSGNTAAAAHRAGWRGGFNSGLKPAFDLALRRNPAGVDDNTVDDDTRRRHHAVANDRRQVFHLLKRNLDASFPRHLFDPRQGITAVGAAGTKNLYVFHQIFPFKRRD